MPEVRLLLGDAIEILKTLPDSSVQTCVTSPPYWGLRDYGVGGQVGLEEKPEHYVEKLVAVFREVKRVLRDDGTLWLNLGDSFFSTTKGSGGPDSSSTLVGTKAEHNGQRMESRRLSAGDTGVKPKDLVGIPWRVAFALQADGWYLRSDIIWHKPNPMPESVTDRPTKAHEYVFLLAKSPRYYYDADAVREPFADERLGSAGAKSLPYSEGSGRHDTLSDGTKKGLGVPPQNNGRNRRSVWTVTTKPYKGAHFATYPPDLIRPCILSGAPENGIVLDPFCGSGTTGQVCVEEGRSFIGIELNHEYVELAEERIDKARTKKSIDDAQGELPLAA